MFKIADYKVELVAEMAGILPKGKMIQYVPSRYCINHRGDRLEVVDIYTKETAVFKLKSLKAMVAERLVAFTAAGLSLKDAIKATDMGLKVKLVAAGTEVSAKSGSSYFGSGCYAASIMANVDSTSEEQWDNGFAAGKIKTFVLQNKGDYAGGAAGDCIGNGITFANTLYICE